MGTAPSLDFGDVLTPQQWADLFADKQDDLGYSPVNKAGDTMTGVLIGMAADGNTPSFRAPPGSAPAVLNNGDIWSTSQGLFVVIGGIACRLSPIVTGGFTLANGLNSNIVLNSITRGRISGPTGAFSVGGFTGGFDGNGLKLYNTTAQAMTLVNEDASSTAANRIKTLTGGNIVLAARTSFASLLYDGTDSRWIVESYNG